VLTSRKLTTGPEPGGCGPGLQRTPADRCWWATPTSEHRAEQEAIGKAAAYRWRGCRDSAGHLPRRSASEERGKLPTPSTWVGRLAVSWWRSGVAEPS
jgi:hypothetical protein